MRLCVRSPVLAVCVLLALAPAPAAAQQSGEVRGTVRAAGTGDPVGGAVVQALTSSGLVAASTTTGPAGAFVLAPLAPGSYAVQASATGYAVFRAEEVTIAPGQVVSIDLGLTVRAIELDPLVVSASRRPEKALAAPAHVESVAARVIEEQPALSPTAHIRTVPGVDAASTGLVTGSVVTRGFNNVFSGALLMITDNRIASVPSLRVNTPYMIPATDDDIERIEVLLGPASALYGPNSANGVMHIITRSPFESVGTTVSAMAGERSVFQGAVRHAAVAGTRVGYKVSAQYLRGDDWTVVDPVEAAARQLALPSDPDTRIGLRDNDLESYKVDGRVDFRPSQNMEVILSSGMSQTASGIELTGLGAGQVRDWRYSYVQGRFRFDRLFAQAFANFSDAGETYLLRTGLPIADESRIYVAQLQHGLDLAGGRQSFTYGLDYQRTQPRTNGTILGRNEGVEVTEIGGYLQSETELLPTLDLIASGRLDRHDYVDETVFSPRAALVFRPREAQTVRLTYNRAFETPTSNNLFLDLEVVPSNGIFAIRTVGVPTDGLRFRRDCASGVGGLCMRTGLNPAAGFIPADAKLLWPGVVAVLRAQGVADLRAIPAPGAGSGVGTVLRVLNTGTQRFVDASADDVLDIEGLEPTISNTLELGYRGLVTDRLLISGDLYSTRKENFVGPLIVETPSVFFDAASLGAYLARFMPAAQAAQLAGAIGGVSDGAGPARGIPVGAVVPDHELTSTGDLYLTYRNFGEVELWGGDLAAELLLTDRISVAGSYSYVSENYFDQEEVGGLSPVALNSPQHKGSGAMRYQSPGDEGVSGEVRVRAVEGFPMNSGVYIGEVDGYAHLDASVSYRLPFGRGALLTVSGQNLLDDRVSQFVGAPAIGRLILTRVSYRF